MYPPTAIILGGYFLSNLKLSNIYTDPLDEGKGIQWGIQSIFRRKKPSPKKFGKGSVNVDI